MAKSPEVVVLGKQLESGWVLSAQPNSSFLEPPVKPILGRKWPLTPPLCGNPRSFAAIKNWRPLFLFRGSRAFAVSAMMPVPFATFFASP
ncbi:MAG TPA: hypothetical protein VN641_01485, partial [Urbifossiella sp.]|nr:hypothetical protein [Urbifossiella sp.]